ncbi:uncharacterized protein ISCGN_009175 [Ixodes scapularis]
MWKIAPSSLFLTFAIALHGCHASKGRQGSPMVCANDSSCSNGQLCVTHYKYLQGQACTEDKFCIDVSTSTCSCLSGYTCRKKNCPSSPFECILAEDQVESLWGPVKPAKRIRIVPVGRDAFLTSTSQVLRTVKNPAIVSP